MWLAILTLLLSRGPQAYAVIKEMFDNGQTEPTADQLARLGLTDDDLRDAYQNAFRTDEPAE